LEMSVFLENEPIHNFSDFKIPQALKRTLDTVKINME
jgi:hypothetical protein